MAWHEGETLDVRLARGPLTPENTVDLGAQAAAALSAAHGGGVVHRRLEPGSVLLGADGRARVLDFGLADLTGGSAATGASPYRAPEQNDGAPGDERSDVWSLGALL